MAEDLQSWLAPNKIYNGLSSALQKVMVNEEVYIVTTKQVWQTFLCERLLVWIVKQLQSSTYS